MSLPDSSSLENSILLSSVDLLLVTEIADCVGDVVHGTLDGIDVNRGDSDVSTTERVEDDVTNWLTDVTTDRVEVNVATTETVEGDVTNWLADVATDGVEDTDKTKDDSEEVAAGMVRLGCMIPPCGVTLIIVPFGFCFFLVCLFLFRRLW